VIRALEGLMSKLTKPQAFLLAQLVCREQKYISAEEVRAANALEKLGYIVIRENWPTGVGIATRAGRERILGK
jgi:hypothetical protein